MRFINKTRSLAEKSGNHYVYALLCQDQADDPLYVKVGITTQPHQRLSAIRTSCPLTPRYFATVDAINWQKQRNLERMLHMMFREHKAHREWFRFDPSNEDHQDMFNAGSSLCFKACGLAGVQWSVIDIDELDAHNKQSSAIHLKKRSKSAAKHGVKVADMKH